MDKHLLGFAWGLPPAFALPSVAACQRALARIGPRLEQLDAAKRGRRDRRDRRDRRVSYLAPMGRF